MQSPGGELEAALKRTMDTKDASVALLKDNAVLTAPLVSCKLLDETGCHLGRACMASVPCMKEGFGEVQGSAARCAAGCQ